MDGLSVAIEVAELAGVLWHIYKKLRDFVQRVGVIDTVARELLDKVDSLKDVVSSVQWVTELLRDPSRSRRLSLEEQRTLQALSKCIAPCNRILGRFYKSLDGLIDDKNNPSWLGKTRRQLKLDDRQQEIKTLESFIDGRIKVLHALLSCLQMFQIDGNHRQIINHIDDLRGEIERVGITNAQRTLPTSAPRLESGLGGVMALIYEEQTRIETHAIHLITDAAMPESISGAVRPTLPLGMPAPSPLLTQYGIDNVRLATPNNSLQPILGPPRIPTPDFGDTAATIESIFRRRASTETRPAATLPGGLDMDADGTKLECDSESETETTMARESSVGRQDMTVWNLALIEASRVGDVEAVRVALRGGADPDFAADTSERPLYIAAHGGHHEVVRHLLEARANPDLSCLGGWTALHCAVHKKQIEVLKVLLSHSPKADINAKCDQGTGLHLTAEAGDRDIAGLLILQGADAAVEDSNQRTALEMAVQTNQVDYVKWWIKLSPQSVVRAERILGARSYTKSLVKNNLAGGDADSQFALSPVSSLDVGASKSNRRRSSANSTSSFRSGVFGLRRRESKVNE